MVVVQHVILRTEHLLEMQVGTLHEGSNEDKPKTAPLSNLHVKQFYTKVRKHTQYLRSISSMWGHTVAFPSDEILPERIIEE